MVFDDTPVKTQQWQVPNLPWFCGCAQGGFGTRPYGLAGCVAKPLNISFIPRVPLVSRTRYKRLSFQLMHFPMLSGNLQIFDAARFHGRAKSARDAICVLQGLHLFLPSEYGLRPYGALASNFDEILPLPSMSLLAEKVALAARNLAPRAPNLNKEKEAITRQSLHRRFCIPASQTSWTS